MIRSRYRSLVLALGIIIPVFGCVGANGQDDADRGTPLLGLPLPIPIGPGAPAPAASGSCAALNHYTAAIAEATIACTGTLGPDSLTIGPTGLLQRNFTQCSATVSSSVGAGLRQTIDDLLGLQQRANVSAKACFAPQWASWRASFLNSGNSVCPSWTVIASLGTATFASVARVVGELPILSTLPIGGILQDVLDATKENFLYAVALPLPPPVQPCGDALSCAQACTGGLPGFFLGTQNQLALGDPCWWLSSTTYASGSNPFQQNGYYHPMSYYGDPPGDIYGHRNRVSEACSRWGGGYHYQGVLELDCVSPGDPNSPCSSICNVP